MLDANCCWADQVMTAGAATGSNKTKTAL